MPTILLAHPNPTLAEPIAKALGAAGWVVHRRADSASALTSAEGGRIAAALLVDGLPDGSIYDLANKLRAEHAALPVVMLCDPAGPAAAAHKGGPTPARAYVDRALPADRIVSEVLRAVRTVPGVARPNSGQQAVMAALAELDSMKADPARPATPQGVQRAELAAPRAELEALHKRVRELEMQKLQLEQAAQKREAEHQLALGMRDEMVRHLELALEALTVDLTNAATGLAEQQDRAGQSESRLSQTETELDKLRDEVKQAHELRKELAEARAQLLASELDAQGLREALQKAMGDVHGVYQRAMEAEAQRTDLIRALEQARARADIAEQAADEHKAALEAATRDANAERQHHGDALGRLKKKLGEAEARLGAAQAKVAELEARLPGPKKAAAR